MADWAVPTIADFKARFFRDFPYAPTGEESNLNFVTDQDIANAIADTAQTLSPEIFGDAASILFLLATAHNLVCSIRNSTMGLQSQGRFLLNSASVGGVSVSNNINERFSGDPMFAGYLSTGYGKMFLDLAYPYTVGNVGISYGNTTAA